MPSTKQQRQSLLLAENIALLSLLRPSPTAPHENPWPTAADTDTSKRALSPAQELDLTSAFAFLSGISDDATDVVAACVEELASGRGIRVVVAVNKQNPESKTGILARIKTGLEEILGHLSRANREEDTILEDLILDAVVRMCKHRILGRINSKRSDARYSKTGRAFLGSLLQEALNAVRRHGLRRRFGSDVNDFAKNAERFLDRLASLETCQEEVIPEHIKGVLRAAHRLNKISDFDRIFHGLSPRDLNPSIQAGLVKRLAKTAHYLECTLYLFHTAKTSGIFKETDVVTVSLDSQLYARSLVIPPQCSLASCLSRYESGASNVFGKTNISSRLRFLNEKNSVFLSNMRKAVQESRVHAEVQIVCYYELHPVARMPRFICSSKDACYLCNLFVQVHGKFHMPRTHGNLYPGWRLPSLPSLNHAQAQLNKSLEVEIRGIIQGLIASPRAGLVLSRNQNESTVFKLSTSPPSLPGFVPPAGPPDTDVAAEPAVEEAEQRPPDGHHPSVSEPSAESPDIAPAPVPPLVPSKPQISAVSLPVSRACGLDTPGLPSPEPQGHPQLQLSALTVNGQPPSRVVDSTGTSDEATEPRLDLTKSDTVLGPPARQSVLSEAGIRVQEPGSLPGSEEGAELGTESGPAPEIEPDPFSEPAQVQVPDSCTQPAAKLIPKQNPTPAAEPEPILTNSVPGPASLPEPEPAPLPEPNPAFLPEPEPASLPEPETEPEPEPRTSHPLPHTLTLTRGQPLTLRLDNPKTTTTTLPSFTAAAGLITIHTELIRSLATRPGCSRLPAPAVCVRIQWLPRRRAETVCAARPRGFVDLGALRVRGGGGGVDVDCGSAEGVYLAYAGEVVAVEVERGGGAVVGGAG